MVCDPVQDAVLGVLAMVNASLHSGQQHDEMAVVVEEGPVIQCSDLVQLCAGLT